MLSDIEELRSDLQLIESDSGKVKPIRFIAVYSPEREGCTIQLDSGCELPGWEDEFFPGKRVWGAESQPDPKLDARLQHLNEMHKSR